MNKVKLTGKIFNAHMTFWKTFQSTHAGGFYFGTRNSAECAFSHKKIIAPNKHIVRLTDISKDKNMSRFVFILGVLGVLFDRFANQRNLVLHTPICKLEPSDENTEFVPLPISVPRTDSIKQYLNDLKACIQQCYQYQELPSMRTEDTLIEAYSSNVCVYFPEVHGPLKLKNQYDLIISIIINGNELIFDFQYNQALYSDAFMQSLCIKFEFLFDQFLNLEGILDKLEILDDDEKIQQHTFGTNKKSFRQSFGSLIEIFEYAAAKNPFSIGLINAYNHISYSALNQRANQLARILISKHQIKNGCRIGILLENKEDYILTILAVLKTGATYVPMDILYPGKMIDFIAKDAQLSLLITAENIKSLSENLTVKLFLLRDHQSELQLQETTNINDIKYSPSDIAYIIYTSGTSGKPNGVMVSHQGVINTLLGLSELLPIPKGANFNFTTSFAFDASLKAIFLPFLNFGSLSVGGELQNVLGIASDIRKHKINVMHATPTLWREMLNSSEDRSYLQSLVCASTGGEKISAALANQLRHDLARNLFNLYGPTETCINATAYHITASGSSDPPIGKPLPNFEVYILDDDLRMVPLGTVGEICVSGISLANGYTDKEQTEKSFVENPHHPDYKLYRTGDLGKWTSAGDVVYVGRKDSQVKINGYRLELIAVENAIRQLEGIDEVIVMKEEREADRDELTCYYSGKAQRKDIRENLSEALPFYMIPTSIVQVPKIPVLPSGKINKAALSALAMQPSSDEIIPPTTPSQKIVVEIFVAILSVKALSIHHDFFQLGGNSIKAIKLIHEIQKISGVKITLREIFKQPTIEKLAAFIDSRHREPVEDFVISPAPQQHEYDLSYAQQRQWIVDQNPLEHKAYTMSGLLSISGLLDVDCVRKVFKMLVQRHESLRTIFSFKNGQLKQQIQSADDCEFEMRVLNIHDHAETSDSSIDEMIDEIEAQGFDLVRGPLIKVVLFRVTQQEHQLFISLDHIISDGWSMQVLIKEFIQAYSAVQNDTHYQLPELKIQYKDFAHWQNYKLSDDTQVARLKNFWMQEFHGKLPLLDLPTVFPRPKQKSFAGNVIKSSLTGDVAQDIKKYCLSNQVTPYVFFLAVLNHFLYKITGQLDLIVGTGASGRTHPILQGQVGLYANILPVRTHLSAETSFTALLDQTKRKVIDCLDYQEYPFLKLLEDLNLTWDKNRSPLFDIMLMVQESSVETFKIEGLKIQEIDLPTDSCLFDLYFNIVERENTYDIIVNYDCALFDISGAQYLLEAYKTLVQNVIVDPLKSLTNYSFGLQSPLQVTKALDCVLDHNLNIASIGEVGAICINRNDLHDHGDHSNERIKTSMQGRYNFDGKVEILEVNPEFLIIDSAFWPVADIEGSICTLGNLQDCKIITQHVRSNRKTVAHIVSNQFVETELLVKILSSNLPDSFLRELTFNVIPFLPYRDGEVDCETLSGLPVATIDVIDEIENIPETVTSIARVAVVPVNNVPRPSAIHVWDVIKNQKRKHSRRENHQQKNIALDSSAKNQTLAYVHGGVLQTTGHPQTLQQALIEVAKQHSEKGIHIVQETDQDIFLSYTQLLEQGSAIAGGLHKMGLLPGSTVLLQFKTLHSIFSAFWGCLLGGFIPVIAARPASFGEKGMVLDKMFDAWKLLGSPYILSDETEGIENMNQVYGNESVIQVACVNALLQDNVKYCFTSAQSRDTAFYQLTSGSTGISKCIPETHIAIIEHILGSKVYNTLESSNISLNWMPLDHVGAILTYHIKSVYLGMDQVQVRTELVLEDPLRWLAYLDKYKVTHTWSPNFGYRLVVNALKENKHARYDLSSMRHFLNGGEQVTLSVVDEFLELTKDFGLRQYCVQPAFGMAEVATAFIYNNCFSEKNVLWVDNDSLNGLLNIRSKGSDHCSSFIELGPPIPGIEIRITDDENHVLPEKMIGRFQIRGNSVMPGYLHNDSANKEVFVGEGWFNSGDLGFISNGKLTVTGREKEMIVIRGNNFYCFEIEDFVGKIEGVLPTWVAACPVKHEEAGTEGFILFYVPYHESKFLDYDLIEKIKLAIASNFKISPEYVIPCSKKDFPKTTSGKIQRVKLQRAFANGEYDGIVKRIDIKFINEKTTVPSWFFEKVWIRKNLKAATSSSINQAILLFLNDDELIAKWRSLNVSQVAVFVKPGISFCKESETVFSVEPGNPDDYRKLFDELSAGFPLTHIVHSWNYVLPETHYERSRIEKALDTGVFSILNCLPSIPTKYLSPIKFIVVTSGGLFVGDNDSLHTANGTISGFLKSVNQEGNRFQFYQLDLEYDDLAAWQEIKTEIFNDSKDVEVAYRNGKRYTSRLKHLIPVQAQQPITFEKNGLYLIAGGLGKIGQKISEYLISHYNASLLIVGSTNIVEALAEGDSKAGARLNVLNQLKKLSSEVEYEAIDITNDKKMGDWIETMEEKKNRKLSGIIHVAGAVENLDAHLKDMQDSLSMNLTKPDIMKMYHTKLFGTCSLFQLLHQRPQAMFITFSSALSYFGGASASAYVSAGTFQDSLVLHNKKQFPNLQTINWTMWNTAHESSAGMEELLKQKGFLTLPSSQAIKSFTTSLATGKGQVFIGLDLQNDHILSELENAQLRKLLRIHYCLNPGFKHEEAFEQLSSFIHENQFLSDQRLDFNLIAESILPTDSEGHVMKADLYHRRNVRSSNEQRKPQTQLQKSLYVIWKTILEIENFDVTTSFFALGGDSLKATQILARIKKQFNVQIELSDIFENPSILKLSHIIENAREEKIIIKKVLAKPYYEVSHAQKRLWMALQTDREDTSYNIFRAYLLEGELDVNILEKSLTRFIQRHEITRTNIITVNGEPKQIVHDWTDQFFNISIDNIVDAGSRSEEIIRICNQACEQQFDLEKDLLIRVKLLKISVQKYMLLFTMHHIISDAWSLSILAKEIISCYENIKNNVWKALPPLSIQYKDYAEWHNNQLRDGAMQKHRAYWKSRFQDGIPVMNFPTDFERPVNRTLHGDSVQMKMDEDLFAELKRLSIEYETSIFTIMVTVVNVLFYRYTGQEDIIFKTPVSGRTEKITEDQIGFYINTLPLYSRIKERTTFHELLTTVRKDMLEAFNHQAYPIDDLIEEFKIKKNANRSPLSDIVILYLNANGHLDQFDKMADIKISEVDFDTRINKFDLRIVFGEAANTLNVKVDYNTDLYRKETIELLTTRIVAIVGVLTRNPSERIDQIELTDEDNSEIIVQNDFAQTFSGYSFNN